jgi:hypothetical protein
MLPLCCLLLRGREGVTLIPAKDITGLRNERGFLQCSKNRYRNGDGYYPQASEVAEFLVHLFKEVPFHIDKQGRGF